MVEPKQIMSSGTIVVIDAHGLHHKFNANIHSYQVWVNDRLRERRVEIHIHTDGGSWIINRFLNPQKIEWVFL